MQIPLIRLVQNDDGSFKIAGTKEVVNPKVFDKEFFGRTIGDAEDVAKRFPMTPSPNAFYTAGRRELHSRDVRFLLCYLNEKDYQEGLRHYDIQRRRQNLSQRT